MALQEETPTVRALEYPARSLIIFLLVCGRVRACEEISASLIGGFASSSLSKQIHRSLNKNNEQRKAISFFTCTHPH